MNLHTLAMRRSLYRTVAGISIAFACFGAALAAAHPFKFTKGLSVHVVAVRSIGGDAAFRLCQGGAVIVNSRRPAGMELMPPGIEPIPGGLPDDALRRQVEALFRKFGRFRLASDADHADIVFVIQAQYGVVVSSAEAAPVSDTPVLLLATAVSSAHWKSGGRDAATLLTGSLWEGVERFHHLRPAAPDGMVEAFSKHPDRPYPAPASARPPLFDDMPPEPGSMLNDQQQPRGTYHPTFPDKSSNPPQPTICAATLPPRAEVAAAAGPVRLETAMAVSVPLLAVGADGGAVADLRKEELQVYRDGVAQPIARLLAPSDPLKVALLIDESESMRPLAGAIQAAGLEVIDSLRPIDSVLIASFGGAIVINSEFTSDFASARQALSTVRPLGTGDRLYDAVEALASQRLSPASGRTVMILLTDGRDGGSAWATAESARAGIHSSSVAVFIVDCDVNSQPRVGSVLVVPRGTSRRAAPSTPAPPLADEEARRFLGALAYETGGRVERAASPREIGQAISAVIELTKAQYSVVFKAVESARDGSSHAVRVESSRPGLTLRFRTEYRTR